MSQKLLSLLSVLLIAVLLAACGGGDSAVSGDSGGGAVAGGDEPLKVVLFINGVLGDKSFFDSAQRGVDRAAAELGIEAKTIEAGLDGTEWEAAGIETGAQEELDL